MHTGDFQQAMSDSGYLWTRWLCGKGPSAIHTNESMASRTVDAPFFADPLQATNKQPIQFHSGIIALGAHSLARADLKKSTMPLIDFIAQELDHVNTNLLKNKTFENVKGQVNSLVN